MCTKPIIREAVEQDAEQIAALGMQVWLHTYATAGVSRDIALYVLNAFTPARLTLAIADRSSVVVVAETPGNIVAYGVAASGRACPSRPAMGAELTTLYVQEHFKGRGVGSALLEQMEHLVLRRFGARLWLYVNALNSPAIGFYAQRKYLKVGVADFELGHQKHENHVLIQQESDPFLS